MLLFSHFIQWFEYLFSVVFSVFLEDLKWTWFFILYLRSHSGFSCYLFCFVPLFICLLYLNIVIYILQYFNVPVNLALQLRNTGLCHFFNSLWRRTIVLWWAVSHNVCVMFFLSLLMWRLIICQMAKENQQLSLMSLWGRCSCTALCRCSASDLQILYHINTGNEFKGLHVRLCLPYWFMW